MGSPQKWMEVAGRGHPGAEVLSSDEEMTKVGPMRPRQRSFKKKKYNNITTELTSEQLVRPVMIGCVLQFIVV